MHDEILILDALGTRSQLGFIRENKKNGLKKRGMVLVGHVALHFPS